MTWGDIVGALVRNGFSLQDVGAMSTEQVDIHLEAISKANKVDDDNTGQQAEVKLAPDGWA